MDKEEIKQIAYDFTTSKGDAEKLEERILSLFGVMPSRLTVEQGHKGLLIGEFFEYIEIEEDEFTKVPVTWSNIKDIYKKIVEFHSA